MLTFDNNIWRSGYTRIFVWNIFSLSEDNMSTKHRLSSRIGTAFYEKKIQNECMFHKRIMYDYTYRSDYVCHDTNVGYDER